MRFSVVGEKSAFCSGGVATAEGALDGEDTIATANG
jgi:hypothetical protein